MGVGSAVSEAFVRELAVGTGGECELVSPREGMADRVVRHFERMRSPRAKRVAVAGPMAPRISPRPGSARFSKVTRWSPVHASIARRRTAPRSSKSRRTRARLSDRSWRFQRQHPPLPRTALSTVAHSVAAAARFKELDDGVGLETALRYRLVSPGPTGWSLHPGPTKKRPRTFRPCARSRRRWRPAGAAWAAWRCPSAWTHWQPRVRWPRSVDFAAMGGLRPLRDRDAAAFTASRPARPCGEPYRRMLELLQVDANASRLDVAGALDLLNGIRPCSAEFDDLFRHAADLGPQCRRRRRRSSLPRLLGGPLCEFLSGDAQVALASLQERPGGDGRASGDGASRHRPGTPDSRACCTRGLRQRSDGEVLARALRADARTARPSRRSSAQVGRAPAARTSPRRVMRSPRGRRRPSPQTRRPEFDLSTAARSAPLTQDSRGGG